MTNISLGNIIQILAMWGAFLSSILGISKLIDRSRRLKIGFYTHKITSPQQPSTPNSFDTVIGLSGTNSGMRPIKVTTYGILLPNGYRIGFEDEHPNGPEKVPKKLEYGDTFAVMAYGSSVQQLFKIGMMAPPISKYFLIKNLIFRKGNILKVKGYIVDSLGKTYKSKKIEIDVDNLV